VAQSPILVPPYLTVAAAAAPAATLPVTLGVLIAGFAVTVPALALLFRVFSAPAGRRSSSGRWRWTDAAQRGSRPRT
jgi:cytochrome bd-type quinol oxidase subunit 2